MLSNLKKLNGRLPVFKASKSHVLDRVCFCYCAGNLNPSTLLKNMSKRKIENRQNNMLITLLNRFYSNHSNSRTTNKFYSSGVDNLDIYGVSDLEDTSSNNLRNFLYPDSKDPIIVSLNDCCSIQEVFDIIDKHENHELKVEHLSQSLLILWDMQRQFCTSEYFAQFASTKNTVFKSYVDQIHSHPSFQRVRTLLDSKFEDLTADSLACTILYVMKMGFGLRDPSVRRMVYRMESFVKNNPPGELSLPALSRFSVALCFHKTNDDLWAKFALISVMPHISYWNEVCENAEDFKLITICMWSVLELTPRRQIAAYHSLVERILSKDIDIPPGSLVKCAFVLDPPSLFNNPYKQTVIRVLRILQDHVHQLTHVGEFYRLNKVFLYHSEPASLRLALRENCARWIKSDPYGEAVEGELSCALFYCLAQSTAHAQRHRLSPTAARLVAATDNVFDLLIIGSSQMRIVMQPVYEQLWPKVMNLIRHNKDPELVLAVAFRYIEVMSTKRCLDFENELLELLFEYLDKDTVMGPSWLAQMALCILSMLDSSNHPKFDKRAPELFERIFGYLGRYTIFDTTSLSRGLTFVLRQGRASDHLPLYIKLENELSSSSLEFLEDKNLSLYDINMLCRGFINRTQFSTASSPHQTKIMERYRDVQWSEISSRSLRTTVFNLVALRGCVPELLEQFVRYVVEEADNVAGSTVSLLLHGLYKLGYMPDDERFYQAAIAATMRDVDMMPGLALLQTALSLAWANRLPSSLIQAIFDVDFLNDLDHEIKFGYSKISYPIRVRRCLMKLNRSVCLDYPEAGVPWFHAEFCKQEALLLDSKIHSPIKMDVEKILDFLAGGQNIIKKDVSIDYGYKLDFLVNLDKKNKIIPHPRGAEPHSKVAVVFGNDSDWSTSGLQRRLRGSIQMRKRHLEILGYRVAFIDHFVWNSMYMTEPTAKISYLSNLISPVT